MRVSALRGPGRALAHVSMPLQVLPAHDGFDGIRRVDVSAGSGSVHERTDDTVLAQIGRQFNAGACPLLPPVRHHADAHVRALARVPFDLSWRFRRSELRIDQLAHLDRFSANGRGASRRNRLLFIRPSGPDWLAANPGAFRYTTDGAYERCHLKAPAGRASGARQSERNESRSTTRPDWQSQNAVAVPSSAPVSALPTRPETSGRTRADAASCVAHSGVQPTSVVWARD